MEELGYKHGSNDHQLPVFDERPPSHRGFVPNLGKF